MKAILQLFFASFLLFSCTENNEVEIGQKTTLEVNPVFDAGKVLHGEEIKASFIVKNTGDYPLIISEVKGSCSCTVVKKPELPIQPGESTAIEATVDTENTSNGAISKEVRLVSNTEPSVTVLKINALVFSK